jgi:hypothetical protein
MTIYEFQMFCDVSSGGGVIKMGHGRTTGQLCELVSDTSTQQNEAWYDHWTAL